MVKDVSPVPPDATGSVPVVSAEVDVAYTAPPDVNEVSPVPPTDVATVVNPEPRVPDVNVPTEVREDPVTPDPNVVALRTELPLM